MIVFGTLASATVIWLLRADALDDAVTDAGNIATVLTEQADTSVEAIEIVLHDLQDRLDTLDVRTPGDFERLIGTQSVHSFLVDRLARLPQAEVIAFVDHDGRIVNFTRTWPAPSIDLSERAYFQYAKFNDDQRLQISEPLANKVTGTPTVYFSKRLDGPDGEFLGVMQVGVGLDYFSNIYGSITALPEQSVLFARSDGAVILRYPDANNHAGERIPAGSPWHQAVASGGGYFRSPGIFDNKVRLVAVQPLKHYPLVIDVAVSESAALEKWRSRAMVIGGGAGATVLCLVALLRNLASQFRNLIHSEDALARRSRELESTNIKFDAALNNMAHGLCMFDAERKFVVCNELYARMYRLPPDLLKPGTPHSEIIAHRVRNGILKGGDGELEVREQVSALSKLACDRTSVRIDEHADGKLIRVIRKPMAGGGWVATHEDITEQRKAEQELDKTKGFLDSIIKSIPFSVIVKDATTLRYILVNQAFEEHLNRPADQILGRTVFDLFSVRDAEMIDGADRGVLQGQDDAAFREAVIQTPTRGARTQVSRRIVMRDALGQAKYIIIMLEDVTERRKTEQRIAFLAHHDALTGLVNRAALAEKIEEAAGRQRRRGETFSVLLIDLDRFKQVNDTLGHAAGDSLLMQLAIRLKTLLRETDVLARLGGDEFAIIQSGEVEQRAAAQALADRVIEMLGRPFDIDGHEVTVGGSIGIALAPEHATSADNLLKMADLALYRVKSAGRNGYCFFAPEMSELASTRHEIESDLRRAIQNHEFEVHYQPIIDAKTRKICSVEALVRWRHPSKGLIAPDRFIPLAEETGLISGIGEQVLSAACTEAASWPGDVKLAVNLSPLQFAKSNLPETVVRVLRESGLPPDRLELEITETALIESAAECSLALRQLKSLGITIVLDDFGTGYSSLSQLATFPFDKIKIDKSFIQNLTKRSECAAIISATLTLAQSLDIATTAEGVETTEQYRLLKLAGVTSLQGYLFKRPGLAYELDFEAVFDSPQMEDAA